MNWAVGFNRLRPQLTAECDKTWLFRCVSPPFKLDHLPAEWTADVVRHRKGASFPDSHPSFRW